MSEEELNEAMQYNLDYTEAMLNDELFRTNEVAEVKLLASEKTIRDLQQKAEQQEIEIDRLNNIINELEIFIKNNKVTIGIKKDSNYAIPVEYVLDKLKELKDSD